MATAQNDTTEFDKAAAEKFGRVYKESGFSGFRTAVIDDISAWENVRIQIAITGNTGAGKSSLVNALRGLNADSDRAAPVGIKETTVEINVYEHQKNPNLLFCDLPGVGSVKFPKESYLETINFSKFDVFIIVSAKRFSDNDLWLANEIASRNKKIFFVRTHIDNDMENNARSKRNKNPEEDILKSIREDCQNNLGTVPHGIDIFLIDNHKRNMYDFPELEWRLIHNTEGLIKEALAMTLSPFTMKVFDEKHICLKKRIWKIALLAAFAPRVGKTDIHILLEEREKYKEQFGLELPKSAQSTNEESCRFELDEIYKDCSDFDEFDEITACLPFFSPIYNQVKIYKASKKWLKETLQELYTVAIERHTSKN